MKRILAPLLILFAAIAVLPACSSAGGPKAVYLLLDTSGTYKEELGKAQAIINYLLGTLESGDSLAVARIDSGSFSEKDIIAKVTFDKRPSVATSQKREFSQKFGRFVKHAEGSRFTDVSGGVLQASEWLDETGARRRYIFIFSDLKEELPAGHKRDFALPLKDTEVAALNVTKLRSDNVNPQEYLDRLGEWQRRVEKSDGHWRVINDLDRIEGLL